MFIKSLDKQLSLEQVEQFIKDHGIRDILKKRMDIIDTNSFSVHSLHSINHAKNVGLFALIIASFLEVEEEYINLIVDAAIMHDIGRKYDTQDVHHGKNGASIAFFQKLSDPYYLDENKSSLLLALIEGHCTSIYNDSIPKKYNIKDLDLYHRLLGIIKDADILDRKRLNNKSFIDMDEMNYEVSSMLFMYSEFLNKTSVMENNGMADDLINSIKTFIDKNSSKLSREESLELKRIMFNLKKNGCSSLDELKKIELEVLKYVDKVWIRQLTDFEQFGQTDDFMLVVTCPTVNVKNYNIKHTLSASLITSKHMGTFNKIPILIVCELEEGAILGISSDDMNSIVVPKGERVQNYHYLNSTNTKDIYVKKHINSIKGPKQVEEEMIRINILKNGNILTLGDSSVYSDILLDSSHVRLKGILVIEPCDELYIEQARTLSEMFHIPFKTTDINYHYQKLGINTTREAGSEYNIYDIDVIMSVIRRLDDIKNENSNLDIKKIGNNMYIGDIHTKDYLLYDEENEIVQIVLKSDSRMFKLDCSQELTCYVDDMVIDIKTMQATIDDVLNNRPKINEV